MARIEWNKVGDRLFEVGVDRGVLYTPTAGVAWNGLVSVSDSPSGGEIKTYYLDGVKYQVLASPIEYSGSISAFTYPDEFMEYEGWSDLGNGLMMDGQNRETFNLSYRTRIGNDVESEKHGYKLHILYNAIATPTQKSFGTIGRGVTPSAFTWNLTTVPVIIPGYAPTSHIIIDSTKIKSDTLGAIEDLLYGTNTRAPVLPPLHQIIQLIDDWRAFAIVPNTSTGMAKLSISGPDDLTGDLNVGLFKADSNTRLKPTSRPGFYTLG